MSKLSMIGSSLAVSGVILGSVIWNGAETLESAKTWINQASSKIELFQSNESKLTEAIKSKNSKISQLQLQISELSNNKTENEALIADLQSQVETLTSEKEALESQLGNEEALVNEVERLNNELTQANADAEALQAQLDSAVNLEEVTVADSGYVDNLVGDVETIYETFAVGTFDYDNFKIVVRADSGGHEVDFTNKMDDTLTLTLYSEAEGGMDKSSTISAGKTVSNIYVGIGLSRQKLYKIEVKDQYGNLLFIAQ